MPCPRFFPIVSGTFSSCRKDEAEKRGTGGMLDGLVPVVRVFSICFVLYIAAFWVRYQMRVSGQDDISGGMFGKGSGGRRANNEELMRLYGVSTLWCCVDFV